MRTVSKPATPVAETTPAVEPEAGATQTETEKTVADEPTEADKKPKPDGEDKGDKKTKKRQSGDANAEDEADDEADTGKADEKPVANKTASGKNRKKAKKATGEPKKRGPPRPYRKLPQAILDSRMLKLKRRVERTSAQAEEGKTFLEKYTREQGFRDAEAAVAQAAEPA